MMCVVCECVCIYLDVGKARRKVCDDCSRELAQIEAEMEAARDGFDFDYFAERGYDETGPALAEPRTTQL